MPPLQPDRRFQIVALILAALALLLAFILWQRLPSSQPIAKAAPSTPPPPRSQPGLYLPKRASLPGQPALQVPQIAVPESPAERSPLADHLNLPTQDADADLAIVQNLFVEYRTAFGAFPTGEDNAQILNALSGNNPRKLAFIAHTHAAVDPRGVLRDRWGTPYFFHLQSSQEIEIRSAGPDHDFYTSDDLLRLVR